MSSAQEYQKSINDLHLELEDKAKEVQKEQEKLDALKVNKLALNKRVDELNVEAQTHRNIIVSLLGRINELREEVKNKTKGNKKTVAGLSAQLELLGSLLENMKNERLSLEDVEKKATQWENRLNNAQESLSKVTARVVHKNKELKDIEKEIADSRESIEDEKRELNDGRDKLVKDKAEFYNIKKRYTFYVKRHLRLYRKEGRAMPQDLLELINNLQ